MSFCVYLIQFITETFVFVFFIHFVGNISFVEWMSLHKDPAYEAPRRI